MLMKPFSKRRIQFAFPMSGVCNEMFARVWMRTSWNLHIRPLLLLQPLLRCTQYTYTYTVCAVCYPPWTYFARYEAKSQKKTHQNSLLFVRALETMQARSRSLAQFWLRNVNKKNWDSFFPAYIFQLSKFVARLSRLSFLFLFYVALIISFVTPGADVGAGGGWCRSRALKW